MLNKKKYKLSLNIRAAKLIRRNVAYMLIMVLFAPSAHAFSYVTFSPPGSPPGSTLDVTYGVDGFVIEDFEDVYLIPGLAISWEEPTQYTVLAGISLRFFTMFQYTLSKAEKYITIDGQ